MPLTAGLLLAAGEVATSYGLPWPSDEEIFAVTSANRAGVRELEGAIGAFLPALARSPVADRASELLAVASTALHLLGTSEDSMRGTRLATAARIASNADEPRAVKHDATPA